MKPKTQSLLLTLFLTCSVFAQENGFEAGRQLADQGRWKEALQKWLDAKQQSNHVGGVDPRVGIAFIELVTEKRAVEYYDLACAMYRWGLSGANLVSFEQEVAQEIERIAPLLSEEEHTRWRSLLENGDPKVCAEILSFWKKKDPTPSTERNERLLEHWERIAYARKHFTKSKSTVYEADERARIYVKYGPPDKISVGQLGTRPALFRYWVNILLLFDTRPFAGSTPESIRERMVIDAINEYNPMPEYEIWFYGSFNTDAPVFFLFGPKEGLGSFGLRNGLEDLIPARAFSRRSARNANGVSPGSVLQTVYYSELAHLHSYFYDRFNELQSEWDNVQREGSRPGRFRMQALRHANSQFRAKRQLYASEDRHNPVHRKAPIETSSFDKTINPVRLAAHRFRFLDRANQPKLALLGLASPKLRGGLKKREGLSFAFTLRTRLPDERLQSVTETGTDSTVVFVLPQAETHTQYELFCEVFDTTRKQVQVDTSGRKNPKPMLIALGQQRMAAASPLVTTEDVLELSDLLIGVADEAEITAADFSVPLVPNDRFGPHQPLQVYLEIYHLSQDADGSARFTLDCAVTNLHGKKRSKEASVALSFDFQADAPTSKETFEIDISELTPGSYELEVTVKDRLSGQTQHRTSVFQVVASN